MSQEDGQEMVVAPCQEPVRDHHTGRFTPGHPNVSPGRPRMDPVVRAMAEAATPKAMKRLIEALDAEKVVHYKGEEVGKYVDHDMRKRAAEAIFARLYGNPPTAVAFDGSADGKPLGLVFIPIAPPTPEGE